MMRPGSLAIVRRGAAVLTMVFAAACASRGRAHQPLAPARLETCQPSLHDSTGPAPRTPQIGAIPADSGALVGTVRDAQWGTGMSHVLIRLAGRTQGQVMTDSLGGFAFRALPPGRYVVRAARLGANPVEVTTVVRAGRPTEVALRLQLMTCRLD